MRRIDFLQALEILQNVGELPRIEGNFRIRQIEFGEFSNLANFLV